MTRCVNLDWLEVHAREPIGVPLNAFYYTRKGYNLKEREYGTRVYREMFTILTDFDEPLIEIRRAPASSGLRGIHDENECHIRLANRTCYFDNAAAFLRDFLNSHGYTDVRISRVDICLDFTRFDEGDDPQAFVRRYIRHKYSKINQCNISGHGKDTWAGQEWNSLSWGSLKSIVTTKMYNKTLELYDQKLGKYKKPYIREAWLKCGFIDDIQHVTKDGELVNVWRVEFSVRSAQVGWMPIELDGEPRKIQSLRNTLDCYDSRGKILVIFASLARHYFHFKKFEKNKRKDRCQDKVLFKFAPNEAVYKIGKPNTAFGSGTTFKASYERLIEKIRVYQCCHHGIELHKACEVIIASMTEENYRSELSNPWSREELEEMRQLLSVRSRNRDWSYNECLNEVRKLLNIKDRTLPKFSEALTEKGGTVVPPSDFQSETT